MVSPWPRRRGDLCPNDAETPWSETNTDDAGQFVFEPDEALAGDWRVEITQDGHQDILIIPVTATGIDYVNISQGPKQDLHYAEIPPVALGIMVALGLGGLVVTLAPQAQLQNTRTKASPISTIAAAAA